MRLLVILPNRIAESHWLSSGFLGKLVDNNSFSHVEVALYHKERSLNFHNPKIEFSFLHHPKFGANKLKFYGAYFLYMTLTYRFNSIKAMKSFLLRRPMSFLGKYLAFRDGVPLFSLFGFPLARSKWLFNFLSKYYQSTFWGDATLTKIIIEKNISVIVFGHCQNSIILPYIIASQKLNIKTYGIINSWDQPTTKGPIVAKMNHYFVPNAICKDELIEYHGIVAENISVLGWIGMLKHHENAEKYNHDYICKSSGFKDAANYILFGANTYRLGRNEVDICREIAQFLSSHYPNYYMLVRLHPNDTMQSRFDSIKDCDNIIIYSNKYEEEYMMIGQALHSLVVINTAGTIALDAIYIDRPVIALAFEDESLPYYDRPSRYYELEHYEHIVALSGMAIAKNIEEVKNSIAYCIDNPNSLKSGRTLIQEEILQSCSEQTIKNMIKKICV